MNRWEKRFQRKLKALARGYSRLAGDLADPQASIHRARRLTKQLRAILALLPNRFQGSIRKVVRDQKMIVKQLGIARDESLFRQNMAQLDSTLELPPLSDEASSVVDKGHPLPLPLEASLHQLSTNVTRILKRLRKSEARISRTGLARQSRKAFKVVLKCHRRILRPSELEHWHDLRKAAKLIEYQMRFLRRYNHNAHADVLEGMTELGKRLGKLNDLAKVKEALEDQITPMGFKLSLGEEATKNLLVDIDHSCRHEMQATLDQCQSVMPLVEKMVGGKDYKVIE